MTTKGTKKSFVTPLISGAIMVFLAWWIWQALPGNEFEAGFWVVEEAYLNKQSGMMAEVSGPVIRVLSDEKTGVPHQKFVIQLKNGLDVIVSHEIGHSGRVPVSNKDMVTVRGEYLWSEPGGVIRLTKRDKSPQRRHGWIEHEGVRYD